MFSEKCETLAGILCAVLALGSFACSSDSKPSDGGVSGSGGEAGTTGSSGAGGAAEPPNADDSLCGKRPGGVLFGDHVVRFETADGDVVQLARAFEGWGVGESVLYRLDGMALSVDGEEVCVGAGDTREYMNTHHNWFDVARGVKGGIAYEMSADYIGDDTLAIYDEADNAILAPTALIQTGAPPFCGNCMRAFALGISEIVANNMSLHADEGSEYEPLIELYNSGSADIDLTGWTLSDSFSDRGKWSLPSMTLPRHETLVVFADSDTSQGSLHASFRLDAAGGQLVLTAPDGRTDGGFSYGPQAPDESLAYSWSTGGYETLATPTPGEPPE